MVLLIIDTQKAITNSRLYNFEIFESNLKRLISTARKNGTEVIYIRHDDGEGTSLTRGLDGFEIYEGFKPEDGEMIFDKTINSAFKGSGLLEYLNGRDDTLIITGLQTDYCIDANVKCAFEHGFHVIVPQNTNTTVDNEFMSGKNSYRYYNEFIWKNRYAKCLSLDETIKIITGTEAK